ncbi:alpha/beta hydrolase family protein [Caulobacter sp. ErkDOM-YI]|uniref:alpha/beta hydrolase family protein n=1 Tax=unclassified Caulobacter TaxID=2648921 RepID=UPI003AF85681
MLKLFVVAALAASVGLGAAQAAPLEAYGRLPAVSSVDISADGQKLAYIRKEGERSTIVLQGVDGTLLRTLEMGDRKVRTLEWVGSTHVLIRISETTTVDDIFFAREFSLGASLNVATGDATALPKRTVEKVANALFSSRGGTYNGKPVIYAGLISTDRQLDLYRIDPDSGVGQVHQRGDDDTSQYLLNSKGELLAKTKYDFDSKRWSLDLRQQGWREAYSVTAPIDTPDLIGRSLDESSIILNVWDENDQTWMLRPVPVNGGPIGEPLGSGDLGVVLDTEERVIAFTRHDIYREYDIKEPRLASGWALIKQSFGGRQLYLAAFTPDYGKLVVYVEGTGEAGGYYLADLAAKKIKRIGGAYPTLTGADVAMVKAIKYKAADGLEINAYLTLPTGKPAKNLPLIVYPHGGPQARDVAGFNYRAQALASRGYAVLQPNFRGSSGYGQAFLEAAYGEWGGKMQTDLSDGVRALAKVGTIDPKRVCIVGASYGGYAALAGITLDKGVYRCAVAVAGVSDMEKMLEKQISQGGVNSPSVRYWKRYMGVEKPSDPKLVQRSPVNYAAQADGPVLLIHGKDDTVVYYDQSTAMRDALKRAGKPVEFISLKSEDHNLSREGTRQQALSAMVEFLERNNPPN